ncbi:DHHC zinc finger domain-containing protein [Rhizobium laguerreae]|uniref:DHHC zinc finger domain-containing protein n=1 Tax=Rhizobium laguerreae TaxID=1076926 RepID=UPI0014420EF9|nr:DHHC zinc finger domain-containing protein [Rhizobium laguerreae]NKM26960.1 hypothetical protein [Rhizobium laguerreae]
MQQIIPTLAFMGLLIALVSAVDRIMDKETKKALGNAIKARITGRQYDVDDVRNPVAFIERIKPFSLRSASVSAMFSATALIVIVYIQYFALNYNFSEAVEGVSKDHLNSFIFFLAYIVSANFIVDYISFTQTLVIIRLINKTDSRKSLIVLLFTDLLASINIFTFVYSFFLVLGVTYLLNFQERTHFVVSLEENEPSAPLTKMMGELGFSDPDRFKNVSILRVTNASGSDSSSLVDAYIFGTKAPEAGLVFPLVKTVLQTEFPTSATSLAQETGTIMPYKNFPDLKVDYIFKGAMNIGLNPPTFWSHWFSVAYLLTDDVQDNFFAVTGLSPGFQAIDRLRDDANTRVAEMSPRDVVVNWCPSDQTRREINDKSCPDSFVFVSAEIPVLDTKLAIATDVGGKLPLYTFFFTSLSLTFVIYLFYLSIYIFKAAWLTAGRFSSPLVRFANFEEHPVTILSIPLILLAGLIYFVLSGSASPS